GPHQLIHSFPTRRSSDLDALLKFNRPRKEWKYEELAGAVKSLEGRSFANGRQMFQVATCVSCHKFGGVGQEFGPDLTKLDPKWTDRKSTRLNSSHRTISY